MIEAYDGVTDPLDHLRTFVDLMRPYAAPDAIMCRSFPPTLKREAKDSVVTLVPRSFRTFDELSRSFVAYFLCRKRKRRTAIGLMQVVREKDESLQEYLARFSCATLGIEDLQMSAVKKGDKYVDAEEAEKVTKNLRERWEVESHKRKARDELRPTNKNRPRSEQMVKEAAQDWPARHKREESRAFTPLNTPHAKLLMEIRDMKELEWPRPMVKPAGKRNQGRYCHFHKDHGHDTEECMQLKEEIERLLRRGLLSKYVKDNRGKQKMENCPPHRVGVINMITGGLAGGGDSNSARKTYARSLGICSIQKKARFSQSTFGEEDLVGMAHPHDDALVIVGNIANFNVKRAFVDGGSAANSHGDSRRYCGAPSHAGHISDHCGNCGKLFGR
ncbi:uncharacterized protein LOC111375311 [Olea europaea var. sylvestris]|uniref:uncharacterized protein LOC111375311 n=1 Tax=Olea europaea var. sylvestris TaxID=158386 RepID=UPI000C1D6AE6|nr:uncharacterized protein LOC111375311 [Olea europaea var. sylvestris]